MTDEQKTSAESVLLDGIEDFKGLKYCTKDDAECLHTLVCSLAVLSNILCEKSRSFTLFRKRFKGKPHLK